MRLILFLIVFSINNLPSFGQGETWNWYLGNKDGISFINGKYPKLIELTQTYLWESNSSISDPKGNMLFYSSADKILDRNGKVLIDTLKASNSASQGNLFLKHPQSSNIFFFSTSEHGANQYGTRMCTITPKSDSFKFDHVNLLVYPNTAEKMNAVNHHNNNDIWIINHSVNEDTFFLFLLKKDGLVCCPIKNKLGLIYDGDGLEGSAQIKFSPSGKKILNNTWYKSVTELFEFDNLTGEMFLKLSIPSSYSVCLEFAPDENIFYVNENVSTIMQYRIDKKYIYNSSIIKQSNREFYNMRIGPDKKIYVVKIGDYLSAIMKPNNIGSNCEYNDTFLKLSEPKNTPGLPNFNQSYFYTPSIDYAYEQDCRANTIEFEGKDTIKASNYKWVFSKGIKTDIITTKDASYSFADTGKWQVRYIASNGARSDTVTKIITIRPKLVQGFLGQDINYCQTLPTLKAPKDMHCIHWYNDTLGELSKVDSLKPPKEGTYFAKATNHSFCVEWDTIKVIKTVPKADFETKDVCQSDSAVFVNESIGENSNIWKFGDGKINTTRDTKHKYQITTSTTFNVTLIAKTDGCSDSITKPITVNQTPDSDFTFTQTNNTFDLKANKTGLKEYKWVFGNTDSITKSESTHTQILKANKTTICLTVSDLLGCTSQTCTTATIGIQPILNANDIKIYPNPNKGKFSIELGIAGNYNLKVYNETGQLVLDKSINGNQTNNIFLNHPKGNYLIEVISQNGEKISKKIVLE